MTFHWQTKKSICLRWACANNLTILYLSSLVYHWLQLGPNSLETCVLQLRWLVKTEAESIRESLVRLSTLKLEFLLEDLPSSPVSPHRSVMICHGVKWYRFISILMTLMSPFGILQDNHAHCFFCLVLAFFSASWKCFQPSLFPQWLYKFR